MGPSIRVAALAATMLVAWPALAEAPGEQGPRSAAHAKTAMASSNHPIVTKAMVDVMKRGGNAMDAALVAAILQPVVEPQMSTIAGDMALLYYEAKSGKTYYLNAELDHTMKGSPAAAGWANYGATDLPDTHGRRIAVHGTPAGIKAAADRFGTLKWAELFKPAIEVAEKGFPMYSFLYAEEADAAMGRLSAYKSGREEFLPNGYVPPVGSTITRPRLAASMRLAAAQGPDFFYKGAWAEKFVREVRAIGGEITMEDLAAYKVRWQEPTRVGIKGGYELIGAPPPSSSGTLMSMIMSILEPFDFKAEPYYANSASVFNRIFRAYSFAEKSTDDFVKDPLSFDVPLQTLLSKDFAKLLTAQIDMSAPKPLPATAEVETSKVQLAHDYSVKDPRHATDTDHIVAVDSQGNMVSLMHTVAGTTFGTGLVIDGVTLNSGNRFPGTGTGAGRRIVGPADPTLILKDGKPFMTIGSPGLTSRAVTMALINYLYYGKSLQESVDAPRFDGSDPSRPTAIEARVDDKTRDELAKRYGLQVRTTTPYNWHMGSVHAIVREPDGTLTGVADPRRTGLAAGY